MKRRKSLKGAARIGPSGAFELYLGGSGGSLKGYCENDSWREYVREFYDFLCSGETERQIGSTLATKTRTSTGKLTVTFPMMPGMNAKLIKGNGEFATFVLILPFSDNKNDDDADDGFGESNAHANEEEEDPAAEFSDSGGW